MHEVAVLLAAALELRHRGEGLDVLLLGHARQVERREHRHGSPQVVGCAHGIEGGQAGSDQRMRRDGLGP